MFHALLLLGLLLTPQDTKTPQVNSVCDISQTFTFYMDGRFARQYLAGHGRDARNWGSLGKLNLDNANLLVLSDGDRRLPYSTAARVTIERFLSDGGTVLMMNDGTPQALPGTKLAARFNAAPGKAPAKLPFSATAALEPYAGESIEITSSGARTISFGDGWETLVQDANGQPILGLRTVGKGTLLFGSRSLFGHKPDASDPINASWITPLLVELATRKPVDPDLPHESTWAELEEQIGPLTLEYHDGTAPFARAIAEEYVRIRPHLIQITGVEPSAGMIKRLLVLPTGGGGFSSGERIAIGAWWGNYPEKRYPMVELIAHEAGHSWVLPYPEPLWNEPIATYLGIQVGKRLEMPEAQATLDRQLKAGREFDPEYTLLDPQAEGARRDLVWGKSYFVFEELERLYGPGAMAKYFRAKRKLLKAGREGYSMDDCVAVWSAAVKVDLFPWFREHGFRVDRGRTGL